MSKFTKDFWMPSRDGLSVFIRDRKGNVIGEFFDCLRFRDDEAEAKANIRLIAAAPNMYGFIASIAALPDEQCMISPMIHEARKLIASIDGEEEQS